MTYTLIGTGNIAWFLGKRLADAGYICKGIYGRNHANATVLADVLETRYFSELSNMTDDTADICIIAVSDDAIEKIAVQLHLDKTTLIHTAGTVAIDILSGTANNYGVLWPMYSINGDNLPEQNDIPCFFEANNQRAEKNIIILSKALTNNLNKSTFHQRKWLHLSAVISNNFTNHLLAICEQVCKQQHIPFALLYPIITQTFSRIKAASPYDLQTGPASRNDETTINEHLNLLHGHPEWRNIYETITTSIESMYNINDEENNANN